MIDKSGNHELQLVFIVLEQVQVTGHKDALLELKALRDAGNEGNLEAEIVKEKLFLNPDTDNGSEN